MNRAHRSEDSKNNIQQIFRFLWLLFVFNTKSAHYLTQHIAFAHSSKCDWTACDGLPLREFIFYTFWFIKTSQRLIESQATEKEMQQPSHYLGELFKWMSTTSNYALLLTFNALQRNVTCIIAMDMTEKNWLIQYYVFRMFTSNYRRDFFWHVA